LGRSGARDTNWFVSGRLRTPSLCHNIAAVTTASHNKTGWTIPQLIFVAFLFLPLYLLFPSTNYDANGVIEAMWVESGTRFSPNHILYTFIGRVLYKAAQAFGFDVRAINVLQVFNAFCGAIAVALAYGAFGSLGLSRRAVVAAAGLWGTSFIFWCYSTDVAYVTLAAVFTAAALWCCAVLMKRSSHSLLFLLGLLISLAILTFQMLIFLLPIFVWPLLRRRREATVAIVTTLVLLGFCYVGFGFSEGHTNPADLVRWVGSYAGGDIPEWGRFDMVRVGVAGGAAIRSFQWDVFEKPKDMFRTPLRPYVWRLGAGALFFVLLTLTTLFLSIQAYRDGKSRFLWLIGAYLLFWPFIIWFDPVASYWFLIPNLFLCAAAGLAWQTWMSRPSGFAFIFTSISVMATATFISWVWNKHIDPGVVGRKAECIAQMVKSNDLVIATDWTWPATLEYFHGVHPIQVIDLAASLHDPDKVFNSLALGIQKTREQHGRVFIVDPSSYTRLDLDWLAKQAQFTAEDFERYPGKILFQCEEAKFREVQKVQ
jgi:hypothetical protein